MQKKAIKNMSTQQIVQYATSDIVTRFNISLTEQEHSDLEELLNCYFVKLQEKRSKK